MGLNYRFIDSITDFCLNSSNIEIVVDKALRFLVLRG